VVQVDASGPLGVVEEGVVTARRPQETGRVPERHGSVDRAGHVGAAEADRPRADGDLQELPGGGADVLVAVESQGIAGARRARDHQDRQPETDHAAPGHHS